MVQAVFLQAVNRQTEYSVRQSVGKLMGDVTREMPQLEKFGRLEEMLCCYVEFKCYKNLRQEMD